MNMKLFLICSIAAWCFLVILSIIIRSSREQRLYQLLKLDNIYRVATSTTGIPIYVHIISKQNDQVIFTIRYNGKEGRPQTMHISDFYNKWGYTILEYIDEQNRLENE